MVLPHDVTGYVPHPFHAADRAWSESNCYVDVWIEILHALGLEVAPIFPVTLASDFEGDQWTFYKPSHQDLFDLYGIAVEELTIWQGLVTHCHEQVSRHRIPLIEMDSFYLPDTQGRGYGEAHAKTTIGITEIDPTRERLVYFHNRSLFELEGADFRGLFRIDPESPASALPPYAEIIKLDHLCRRSGSDLSERTIELVRMYAARRPTINPIQQFAKAVDEQLSQLIESRPDAYDAYAFASIRQCGSSFGFTADCLAWLAQDDERWAGAAEPFVRISSLASMLVMKMARVVYSGRLRGLEDAFSEMADAWDVGMRDVERRLAL